MPRDLPSLNALRSFEAAARLESVSRAADELNVTHGAVSRQLRSLEDELGVALFEKAGRGLKLTGSGRLLRDSCEQAFGDLRNACIAVRQAQAQAPFLLACPGSLLARWFIPRLDRLNRELPELNLHLSASEAELDPRRPGVTATFLFAAPPWPTDLAAYPLIAERIGPVFSPRLASAQRLQRNPADALLGEPLLHTASRPTAWLDWAAQLPGWLASGSIRQESSTLSPRLPNVGESPMQRRAHASISGWIGRVVRPMPWAWRC